jgi:hypothetical protein
VKKITISNLANSLGMAKKTLAKKKSRKSNPVLKAQYTSTAFFNTLASQIMQPLRHHAEITMVNRGFYRDLLKRFRRVREHNFHRWLLVRTLRQTEVNVNYNLEKIGLFTIKLRAEKKKLWVQLDMIMHPTGKTRYHQANCYYYEIILLAWNKKEQAPHVLTNETVWIDTGGGLPSFEIPLERPAGMTHWLLFVHGLLGKDNKAIGSVETRGLRCVDAGSFDPQDLKYQAEWEKSMKQAAAAVRVVGKEKKEGVKASAVRGK